MARPSVVTRLRVGKPLSVRARRVEGVSGGRGDLQRGKDVRGDVSDPASLGNAAAAKDRWGPSRSWAFEAAAVGRELPTNASSPLCHPLLPTPLRPPRCSRAEVIATARAAPEAVPVDAAGQRLCAEKLSAEKIPTGKRAAENTSAEDSAAEDPANCATNAPLLLARRIAS